jgi:cell division protein FtsW
MAAKVRRKKQKRASYFDYGLLFFVIFLIAFGLVMLYSVSSYNAQVKFGDSAYYLKRQIRAVLLGVVAMFIVARVDYHIWYRFAPTLYIIAIGLNFIVMFAGDEYSGSTRWLKLGPISFQPSEFAKIGVILFVSYVISRAPKKMIRWQNVAKVFGLVLPLFILVAVANLSTAIIVLGIAFTLLFVSSPKYKPFAFAIALCIGFASIFLVFASYRMDRIKIWLNPAAYDKGYQTLQGLYAIGSGGLFGKGLGNSLQKLGFVPEPENDMIFSIVCEELGLVGAICVILLFLLMLWRLMVIANNTDDMFGSYVVIGIMTHIALQVILNIAVVTNTIPNTGITLPFISYGGTSTSILLGELGIALSISRGIRLVSIKREALAEREGEQSV